MDDIVQPAMDAEAMFRFTLLSPDGDRHVECLATSHRARWP
ncbi:MAG TPA: hypothetical protein VG244_00965 [Acidimicrobiales bacterium]|nr:hypothetical protein [Acidimicrobiales bacterium]